MPKLIEARPEYDGASKRCNYIPIRLYSRSELAVKSLSSLWCRLLNSYGHFTQVDTTSFVVPVPGLYATKASLPASLVPDSQWQQNLFGRNATAEALIHHLYTINEEIDTHSWLIAFCLVDKLQLGYYVQQRIARITFWQPISHNTELLQLHMDCVFHYLFAAYCIALKWHLDYNVSIKYIVGLLPHRNNINTALLRGTVLLEKKILKSLEYNCYVHEAQISQLIHHFLTPSERHYIASAS